MSGGIMLNKEEQYEALVDKRKSCRLCAEYGFCNPNETAYETDEIGPYSKWAHDLNAEVMIVAQDFADKVSYDKFQGTVQMKEIVDLESYKEYDTMTNYNLRALSKNISQIKLGCPSKSSGENVFITNVVLCLKTGNMSGPFSSKATKNCSQNYLKPLIDIIKPKALIALGSESTFAIINLFKAENPALVALAKSNFKDVFKSSPIRLNEDLILYPMYHPSNLGVNNRNKIEVEKRERMFYNNEDWKRVRLINE